MINLKHLTRLIALPAIFITLFFLSSCEEDTKTVTEIQTVTVTDTVEVTAVMVDDVVANPDSISVGGSITLTASVTKDAKVGDLTFTWSATSGELSAMTGDTITWKAPDDPGTYTVKVIAEDGDYSAVGKRNIGVGMYAATADVYYTGATRCNGCHGDIYDGWAATGHAEAWAGLQSSDHAQAFCNKCHSVDYFEVPGDGGYDDAPIAMFEDVQCENCHGPSSAHPLEGGELVIDITTESCTTCHSGDHHPFERDWLAAGHNFDVNTAAHGAGARSGCDACHSGSGFIAANDEDFEWEGDPVNVSCAACHDPHLDPNENEHQLRVLDTYTSVIANGKQVDITVTGNGQLCVQCHHARRSADSNNQITEGYPHFGPHGSPQGDMIAGVSAYENLNGFDFSGGFKTAHYLIEDACVTCHMHVEPYPNANTGHSFEATVESCARCHGELASFDAIKALEDFDGDGMVEGVQTEVKGLLNAIAEGLIVAGLDTTDGGDDLWEAVIHGLEESRNDTLADGSQKPENLIFREVGYNFVFVLQDGSYGVHNPDYSIQMLQQALIYLEDQFPPPAAAKFEYKGRVLSAHQKAVRF